MNPSTHPCPDPAQLLAYREGQLPEEQLLRIADHLEDCPDCCINLLRGVQGNPEPLLAELREDLRHDPQPEMDCSGLVARIAAIGQPEERQADPAPPTDDLPPELPRGFELLEKLGEGGMGKVYKARQLSLGRIIALKVLSPRLRSAVGSARFQQEMLAIGQLDNPHVARALHAEVEGTPYLAMEYVDGINLAALVKQHGPLPIAAACEVARQAALGLQHIHEHGLVHRDIKPSNLMLTSRGIVKVLDLGLARLRDEGELSASGLTGTGSIMGTPDYMAPEQLLDSHQVDIRADIYSLGCSLYELLAGAAPFAGYRTLWEKRQAQLTQPPPPMPDRWPEVPESLMAILGRMLAKTPALRYPTPAGVVEALLPFTAGHQLSSLALGSTLDHAAQRETPSPTPSTKPERQPPKSRWSRRRFLRTTLGGLALMGGGVTAWWAFRPLRIVGFDVIHYRADGDRTIPVPPRDGLPLHAVQHNDYLRVKAELNRNAYCYLIAFNPNGTAQLCYPFAGEQDQPPQALTGLIYPRGNAFFKLDDGDGLQAFVLLVSRKPLLVYADWKRALGPLPWRASAGDGEWRFDGETFEPLVSGSRGTEEARPVPEAFVELCRFLQERTGAAMTINAVVFPVRPMR